MYIIATIGSILLAIIALLASFAAINGVLSGDWSIGIGYSVPAVLLFAFLQYMRGVIKRKAKVVKMDSQSQLKVPEAVQEKLLPEEKAISQLASERSIFILTNKRLIRFSAGRLEPLDHQKISAVNCQRSLNEPKSRAILGLVALILFSLIVATWLYTLAYVFLNYRMYLFSSSIRTSLSDAIIITLIAGIWAVISLIGMFSHIQYYQIESVSYDQNNKKSWRIVRPAYFGKARVEEFVNTLRKQIAT